MDDHKKPADSGPPQAEDSKARENRGNPPGYGSGEVTGEVTDAGAGAGGSGGPEDYDADPMGGGSFPPAGPSRAPNIATTAAKTSPTAAARPYPGSAPASLAKPFAIAKSSTAALTGVEVRIVSCGDL